MNFKAVFRLILLITAAYGVNANATTYFLKFTTSGATATATGGSNLHQDASAWVEVSIVTSPGTDGNVHWLNGPVESHLSYKYYFKSSYSTTSRGFSNANYDHVSFYVAGVPRSVRIINHDASSEMVITHGDSPQPFPAAPSFLLPDGFIVFAGLTYYYRKIVPDPATEYRKIFIGAFPKAQYGALTNDCPTGWVFSSDRIEVKEGYNNNGSCSAWIPYSQPLSHVVRFE